MPVAGRVARRLSAANTNSERAERLYGCFKVRCEHGCLKVAPGEVSPPWRGGQHELGRCISTQGGHVPATYIVTAGHEAAFTTPEFVHPAFTRRTAASNHRRACSVDRRW